MGAAGAPGRRHRARGVGVGSGGGVGRAAKAGLGFGSRGHCARRGCVLRLAGAMVRGAAAGARHATGGLAARARRGGAAVRGACVARGRVVDLRARARRVALAAGRCHERAGGGLRGGVHCLCMPRARDPSRGGASEAHARVLLPAPALALAQPGCPPPACVCARAGAPIGGMRVALGPIGNAVEPETNALQRVPGRRGIERGRCVAWGWGWGVYCCSGRLARAAGRRARCAGFKGCEGSCACACACQGAMA